MKMPLHEFVCSDCKHKQDHFLATNSSRALVCPECESEKYVKQLSSFTMNVEYSDVKETIERKINPSVRETQAQIGREVLDQDTKTLDNLYGKDKVEKTFYNADD
jgi:putative FmdB family regulatory protein